MTRRLLIQVLRSHTLMSDAPILHVSPVLQRLGVPHCFTTRVGGSVGVSRGVFTSLNFGNPGDLPKEQRDPPSNIHANLVAVANALGVPSRPVVQVHQVHGGDVHFLDRSAMSNPELIRHDPKADAIVTTAPVLAGIRTADCAPILLASDDGAVVGAVHAGWRGVVAGVLLRAIEVMRQHGAKHIVASIGPCIGAKAFEVDADVATQFQACFAGDSQVVIEHARKPGSTVQKYGVELQRALRLQLEQSGVHEFDVVDHCTYERSDLYFSHRRDKGMTGRMIALIGPAK